jgi:hypothetical protein
MIMTIKNKAALGKGLALGISFLAVLVTMFSPVFENGKNGLEFADNVFNRLSKGSSYFIPKVQKDADKFAGRDITLTFKMATPDEAAAATKLLTRAGAQAGGDNGSIKVSGDFGKILNAAVADADAGFKNDRAVFTAQYGLSAEAVLPIWWNIMKGMDKAFTKQKKFTESSMVVAVMKKAIEPANNYFGIEAQKVTDKGGIMGTLLVFYVVYTIWWGFAIFFLFEAIGLVMKKAKKKEEV